MQLATLKRAALGIAGALVLSGCGSIPERAAAPPRPIDARAIEDAVPAAEPFSPYGNPPFYVVDGKTYYTLRSSIGFEERGIASWYGTDFHGHRTSSGERYDMYGMTAAHKGLPLPSYVEITNLENRRKAVVRVNDRGPFHDNRIIDLSYAAAVKLGMSEKGTAFVEVKAIGGPRGRRKTAPAAPVQVAERMGIFLQVGAFADRTNAEKLRQRAAAVFGAGVRISEIRQSGKAFYRVQIGPIANVEIADQTVSSLGLIGVTEHRFVGGH